MESYCIGLYSSKLMFTALNQKEVVALKERLYTIAEIAEYLSMTQDTIRRWIKEGQMPAIKLDRELRVKESDLEAFLEARRIKGEDG
jgi:excisionase family DNA binding protein